MPFPARQRILSCSNAVLHTNIVFLQDFVEFFIFGQFLEIFAQNPTFFWRANGIFSCAIGFFTRANAFFPCANNFYRESMIFLAQMLYENEHLSKKNCWHAGKRRWRVWKSRWHTRKCRCQKMTDFVQKLSKMQNSTKSCKKTIFLSQNYVGACQRSLACANAGLCQRLTGFFALVRQRLTCCLQCFLRAPSEYERPQ